MMRSNQERINNIYKKVSVYHKERKKKIIKLSVFACIAFITVNVIIYAEMNRNKPDDVYKNDKKGIYVSAATLSAISKEASDISDMKPLILFNENVYTFDQSLRCNETIKKSLLGEYLGNASGSLSESQNKDGYKEFASTSTGKVFSINNYDIDFRIGIYHEENSYIELYNKLNDIYLDKGKDLYEEKLSLKYNYADVLYQTHVDYMNIMDNYKECSEKMKQNDMDEFIDALYNSSFVKMSNQEEVEKIPNYDTDKDKIAHLYFKMDNGTTVKMTLYKNGYILYGDMCRVYVNMNDKIFDKIFNSIVSD